MAYFDRIRNVFTFKRKKPSDNSRIGTMDYGKGRVSKASFMRQGNFFDYLPRRARRELGLDQNRLKTYDIFDLIDIFIDAHPDMSFTLWNFLRLANSGYKITVRRLDSDETDEEGKDLINEFIERLDYSFSDKFMYSVGFNKIINQLLLSALTRGAVSFELVLSEKYDDVAYIAPVDPATIEFKIEDGRFVPYQFQEISLDTPTFFYEELDSRIDDPYGRSPFISAISMIFFQLEVLNDIKAVVHSQGYPRFDIKILEEVLLKRMPITIRNNEEKKEQWLRDRLNEIIQMYENLDPDDAFVHYDSVEISMVGGKGSTGGAMLDPEKLMSAIDNLIMAGLKTLSTILGRRSKGQTESYAKIEVKLFLKGVEAIQEVVERVMSRALTMYLNIRGKQGIVKFEFMPVDIRSELERAQFEQIAFQNWVYARDQGWISQEEAAMRAVGHEPVGDPVSSSRLENKDGEPPKGTPDEKGPAASDNFE